MHVIGVQDCEARYSLLLCCRLFPADRAGKGVVLRIDRAHRHSVTFCVANGLGLSGLPRRPGADPPRRGPANAVWRRASFGRSCAALSDRYRPGPGAASPLCFLRPWLATVRLPGSARTDQVLGDDAGEKLDDISSRLKQAAANYDLAVATRDAAAAASTAGQGEVARLQSQINDSTLIAPTFGRIQYKRRSCCWPVGTLLLSGSGDRATGAEARLWVSGLGISRLEANRGRTDCCSDA